MPGTLRPSCWAWCWELLLHQDLGAGAMQLAMLFRHDAGSRLRLFRMAVLGSWRVFSTQRWCSMRDLRCPASTCYNNGFSGGLIAIVLYPIITAAIRHRKPELQDEDYFDAFEHDTPTVPRPGKEK